MSHAQGRLDVPRDLPVYKADYRVLVSFLGIVEQPQFVTPDRKSSWPAQTPETTQRKQARTCEVALNRAPSTSDLTVTLADPNYGMKIVSN